MAYDFPNAPAPNDEYTPVGGPTWRYGNGAWSQTSSVEVSISGARFFDTMAQAQAAFIESDVQAIRLAGYYTPGDFGGALYKKVSSAPTHNGKFQSADGAWWENAEIILTPQMFGAKADNVFDCYQAIMDAIESRFYNPGGWFYPAGPTIFFPPGLYKVSQTIQLKRQCHLTGSNHGMAFTSGHATLNFPINTIGIIIHSRNTFDSGTAPTTFAGGPCIIEGIGLTGVRGGLDKTKHGIWMRAMAVIRNVYIDGFAGNGIHIAAQAGAGGALEGNANLFRLEYCRIQSCGGNGIETRYADSNGGTGYSIDCSSNGRWGILEASFLGNTWIGCHTAGNGAPSAGSNTATQSAQVSYGGLYYVAAVGATEAQLVATVPGTDAAVWIATQSAHPTPWLPGQPEGTYFYGGAYALEGLNNTSTLISCYAESDQAGNVNTARAFVIGGLLANGSRRGHGLGMSAQGEVVTSGTQYSAFTVSGATMQSFLGGNDVAGQVLQFGHKTIDGGYPWRLQWQAPGDYIFTNGGIGTRIGFLLSSNGTTQDFGTGAPVPGKMYFQEYGVGLGTNARLHTAGTSPPLVDVHARGEIFWNSLPVAGGKVGWVCTTTGTPGTWKAFGAIDP